MSPRKSRWPLALALLLGGVFALRALSLVLGCDLSPTVAAPVLPALQFVGGASVQGNTPTGTIFAVSVQVTPVGPTDAGNEIDAGFDTGLDTGLDTGFDGTGGAPVDSGAHPSEAGVPGVTITLSVVPTATLLSPASVVTNGQGIAIAYVLVPYDSAGIVTATGAGMSVASEIVPNGPVSLCVDSPVLLTIDSGETTSDAGSDGDLANNGLGTPFSVTATANANDGGVPGLALSFSLVGASSTAGSSATATTNEAGAATADLLAPYDTESVVVVTGGGATQVGPGLLGNSPISMTVALSNTCPPRSLGIDGGGPAPDASADASDASADATADGSLDGSSVDAATGGGDTDLNEPAGTIYCVTATATGPSGIPAVGLPVTFAIVGAANAALVGSGAVSTDGSGRANAAFLVPYGAQVTILASGGGGIGSTSLHNEPVTVTVGAPDGGSLGQCDAIALTASGSVCLVNARATANSQPVPGVPLVFSFAASNAPTTTVLTAQDGTATAELLVPYNSQTTVVVTAAGTTEFGEAPLENGSIGIVVQPGDGGDAAPLNEGAGTVYQLIVSATDGDGGVPGIPVSLAIGAGGTLLGSSPLVTGATGTVSASVLVSYGAVVSVVATAAGGGNATTLSNGPVLLSFVNEGTLNGAATADPVTVAAQANDAAVPGLTLTFNENTSLTVATAVTSTDGSVTVTVPVAADATTFLNVSGGNSSTSIVLNNVH